MTPPPEVTDEELAEVERECGRASAGESDADRTWWRIKAARLAREVRIGRAWKALALALIYYRAIGSEPGTLAAVEALGKLGVKVP
jgi:hypothetical protein